ncbi:hypothetical protein AYI69_g5536, partial [Smittium culicis]
MRFFSINDQNLPT